MKRVGSPDDAGEGKKSKPNEATVISTVETSELPTQVLEIFVHNPQITASLFNNAQIVNSSETPVIPPSPIVYELIIRRNPQSWDYAFLGIDSPSLGELLRRPPTRIIQINSFSMVYPEENFGRCHSQPIAANQWKSIPRWSLMYQLLPKAFQWLVQDSSFKCRIVENDDQAVTDKMFNIMKMTEKFNKVTLHYCADASEDFLSCMVAERR
ncbi:hypothetical protein L596_001401 [Steinernema carpocapsae]|uniref:Uncharacterized protein n=1 Tax=Steinernema carpocapsae TaxID=34508 RepID=A0A4U8UM62_STECR|nr:hypothetical protein L596_001401 [Steinernema carpocapsae]